MSPKPHRLLIDRVQGYADEAQAYLRRRRAAQQPFARLGYAGERAIALTPDTDEGRAVFRAAAELIEAARNSD